jgi:predicted RNase H-like HicB family nuclease
MIDLNVEAKSGQRIHIEITWPPERWNPAEPLRPLGYCFDAVLTKDEESGGYVASVAQLRGVVSQGDDVATAIQNLMEAFQATIETYKAESMPIPWNVAEKKGPNEYVQRVAVHA